MVDIGGLISSKVRVALLSVLALNPESAFHVNELIRRTGFAPRGVARELKNLLSSGILIREVSGNQHRYQLDPDSPINKEIKGLILKTVGVPDVIREALDSAKEEIELAFVFGSFASGDYGNESDVDLFVVGDLPGVKLAELLLPVQNEIGRPINVSQFTPTEYRRKRKRGDHFIKRVFEGPTITIIGTEDES